MIRNTAKAISLSLSVGWFCSLSGQFLLEIPVLACLLGWTSRTTLGRRHPREWCGRKGSFQIIQWPNYVTLACKLSASSRIFGRRREVYRGVKKKKDPAWFSLANTFHLSWWWNIKQFIDCKSIISSTNSNKLLLSLYLCIYFKIQCLSLHKQFAVGKNGS